MPSPNEILNELKKVKYPGFTRDIVSFGLVKDIEIGHAGVAVFLGPVSANPDVARAVAENVKQTVAAMPGIGAVRVEVETAPPTRQATVQSGRRPVPGIQHVVAVASGKGGVGKSTVAVNLALAMHALGRRVGLMDADVYGPSVAMMMGAEDTVRVSAEKRIIPLQRYGIRYVSMALFVNDQTPVIWRGPMVTKLETEFLFNVDWGELDCLVLDLPPGTGDAQLTITQRVALAGGIIVTTPQEVALLDVKRGVTMFNQVDTAVLGVIENMSYYICRRCGHRHEIFGHGGGARMAAELGLEVLGELPIAPEMRAGADHARPLVAVSPEHPASQEFMRIAASVCERLDRMPKPVNAEIVQ
jgi:ATP-binding protein involved in chromosome partitioning